MINFSVSATCNMENAREIGILMYYNGYIKNDNKHLVNKMARLHIAKSKPMLVVLIFIWTFAPIWPRQCVAKSSTSWWRHQMETFSGLLAICAGNSSVTVEFPAQMPVTRTFDVFFDLRLNKRLSKQSWGWWFETPLHLLWFHYDIREWLIMFCSKSANGVAVTC